MAQHQLEKATLNGSEIKESLQILSNPCGPQWPLCMVDMVITFMSSVHGTSQNLHVFPGFDRMEWWGSAGVSLLQSASRSLIVKDCAANDCT